MSRRFTVITLSVLAIAACKGVDRLLEGVPEPTDAHLTLALPSNTITVTRGSEQTISATATRVGQIGQVDFSVDQLPDGVTATVGTGTTSGVATTTSITIRADAGAQLGTFVILVRGRSGPQVDASQSVTLVVMDPPQYALSLSSDPIVVARGGIARFRVRIGRTNFSLPVTLALQAANGVSGVSGTFAANPVAGDTTTGMLSIAASVAAGPYTATVRGTAEGLTDRTVSLPLTVTADPMQLIAPTTVTTPQGSAVVNEFILNRAGASDPVTLSVDGLPAGATATFEPTGLTWAMRIVVVHAVPAATYPLTIRAKSAGVPDATASLQLVVIPSSIELTLTPPTVAVFQGSSVSSALAIVRTAFSGALAIAAENVPAGVTVTVPPPVAGNSAQLSVSATNSAPVGQYEIRIRATPVSELGPSQTATLNVTVRAATGSGNVLLEWSGCEAPVWVGYLDGTGPWTRAEVVSGAARFTIATIRGGYAWVDSDTAVSVRFMLRTEMIGGPINMCGAGQPTKTINGYGEHTTDAEFTNWSLGGGIARSTAAAPSFSMPGVRSGAHDLIGFGLSRLGQRALIRRDLNLPSGGSLAPADLTGPESFAPLRPILTITGGLVGEQFAHTMSYLTTPACTVNPLYTTQGNGQLVWGMPDSVQRVDDFHLLSVVATTASTSRSSTLVFHSMSGNRSQAVPAPPPTPAVTSLAAPFRRFNALFTSVPTQYNQLMSLSYRDGRHAMTATATIGYTGTGVVNLSIPDFTTVAGFPIAATIPVSSTGKWTIGLDGTRLLNAPLCTEGGGSFAWRLAGSF